MVDAIFNRLQRSLNKVLAAAEANKNFRMNIAQRIKRRQMNS
jgi:hypothetical protein